MMIMYFDGGKGATFQQPACHALATRSFPSCKTNSDSPASPAQDETHTRCIRNPCCDGGRVGAAPML